MMTSALDRWIKNNHQETGSFVAKDNLTCTTEMEIDGQNY